MLCEQRLSANKRLKDIERLYARKEDSSTRESSLLVQDKKGASEKGKITTNSNLLIQSSCREEINSYLHNKENEIINPSTSLSFLHTTSSGELGRLQDKLSRKESLKQLESEISKSNLSNYLSTKSDPNILSVSFEIVTNNSQNVSQYLSKIQTLESILENLESDESYFFANQEPILPFTLSDLEMVLYEKEVIDLDFFLQQEVEKEAQDIRFKISDHLKYLESIRQEQNKTCNIKEILKDLTALNFYEQSLSMYINNSQEIFKQLEGLEDEAFISSYYGVLLNIAQGEPLLISSIIYDLEKEKDNAILSVLVGVSSPRFSKHHSGYTVDFGDANTGAFGWGFVSTQSYKWLYANDYANAKAYGFIPSYPIGGGPYGPNPEAWEFTWVGKERAKLL